MQQLDIGIFLMEYSVQAEKYFRNGDMAWGSLTIVFMFLPTIYHLDPRAIGFHYLSIIKHCVAKFKCDFKSTVSEDEVKDLDVKVLKQNAIGHYH